MGTQFTKDWPFYRGLGLDIAFTTESNELHRRRRAPLNAFFSRRSVLDLEALVQTTARKLCDRVAAGVQAGDSVDLGAATRALSVDVITEYAFNESWGQLDREDLGAWWSDMVRNLSIMMLHFQQWPLLQKVLMSLPEWIGAATDKAMAAMVASQQVSSAKRTPPVFHFLFPVPSLYLGFRNAEASGLSLAGTQRRPQDAEANRRRRYTWAADHPPQPAQLRLLSVRCARPRVQPGRVLCPADGSG